MDATGVIVVQIQRGPPSEAWYSDISIVDLTKNRGCRDAGERARVHQL